MFFPRLLKYSIPDSTILSLAWKPDPTAFRNDLGLATKRDPTTFDIENRKDNVLGSQTQQLLA